jgi:YesN/AraC family two-component response regulator
LKREQAVVLIVDDEQEIREALRRDLQFLGYAVETAGNGKEALECMNERKFDVVISDIMMPVMNGVDLLREIRVQFPMTHVIMITGYVTMENVLACMRYGADTCVFKPLVDLKELEEAVAEAIGAVSRWKAKLKQLLEMKP